MKKQKRRGFTLILVVVALITWTAIRPEYIANHAYYREMVSNINHWMMLMGAVGVAIIGLTWGKQMTTWWKKVGLWTALIIIFAMIHTGLKGGLSAAGIFGLIRKHIWILAVIGLHLMSLHALGSWISQTIFRLSRTTTHIILTMAMGLVANMLIIYLLLLIGGMYPVVVWLIFMAMAALIYLQWSDMSEDYQILYSARSTGIDRRSWLWWLQQGIVVAAIVYLLYGFQLALIPYSTAWDANHAYMFFPKIWADNHGLYRSDGPWTSPFIRYSYIAQWFSTMSRLTPLTGIARDTMAVMMNFVTSAVGILIVGVALFDTVARWFTKRKESATIFSLMSGMMLILWLTSGMGAFLVFVDNKTDLGILLLVMVALLSAFMFLTHMDQKSEQTLCPTRYAMMSGFFFGIAFLGKPTAFIDIVGFVTMVVGTQLGIFGIIGLSTLIIGLMAAMQLRSTGTYLEPSASRIVLGGLLLLPAPWVEKVHHSWKRLRLLLVRGLVLVATIVLGKMPYLAMRSEGWSGSQRMRSFLLSNQSGEQTIDPHMLLTVTGEIDSLDDDIIIQEIENQSTTPSIDQCSLESIGATMDELRDNQRRVVGGQATEDNARYVGYGQRILTGGNAGLSYDIAAAIFASADGCYTTNNLAHRLCQSRDQLTPDMVTDLVDILAPEYEYASEIQSKLENNDIFVQDAVALLNEYYQSRTLTTTSDSVAIPYRWLVPLNITFNWSLQNLSSYYTDIGVVWLPALLIVCLGLLRGLIIYDRKIIALTGATILIWMAWMLVADAIVWYGMGMIVWTIIAAVAVLVRWLESVQSDNNVRSIATRVVMIACAILLLTQWLLNMMRISSQGAGGVFLEYKQGLGTLPVVELVDGQLFASNTLQTINQSSVFGLQFPHYAPIIDYLEMKQPEDGVFIAGTYMQYFLRDQSNIRTDNLVTSLRREMSDGDVCASYLRLRDTGYRTIVIDPNIATVVLGEGNQSLKERFIMKEDDQGNRIDDGVISMMVRMVMADYMKLFSTNNIGLYYAYALSTDELVPYMEALGEADEVTFRTRMAMARFLPQEMLQSYFGAISQIFYSRFGTYDGMRDMGRIYGEELDMDARKVVSTALQGVTDLEAFEQMSNSERLIVYRYTQLISAAQNPQTQSQVQSQLFSILQQSISSQSQIAAFTLK